MNKRLKFVAALLVSLMAVAAAGMVVLVQSDESSAAPYSEWDGSSDIAIGAEYQVGASITVSGSPTIAGTLHIVSGGVMIVNSGTTLTVTGTILFEAGTLQDSGTITGSGTVGYFGTKLLAASGDSHSSATEITIANKTGGVVINGLNQSETLAGTVRANGNYIMIKTGDSDPSLSQVYWDKNQDGLVQDGELVQYNSLSSFKMLNATVYGGSDTRSVSVSNISISSGVVGTIIAGNDGYSVTSAALNISGGTITNVYGCTAIAGSETIAISVSNALPTVATSITNISISNVADDENDYVSATLSITSGADITKTTVANITGGNGNITSLAYNITGGTITDVAVAGSSNLVGTATFTMSAGAVSDIIAGDGSTINTLTYTFTGGTITHMTAAFADGNTGTITSSLSISNTSGTPSFTNSIVMGTGIESTGTVTIDMDNGTVILEKSESPSADAYSLSILTFNIVDGTLSIPSTTAATITSDIAFNLLSDAKLDVSGILTFNNGTLSYASMADITTAGSGKIIFNHGANLYYNTSVYIIRETNTDTVRYRTTSSSSIELTSTSAQGTNYSLLIKGNVFVESDPAVADTSKVTVDNGAILTLNSDMTVSNIDGIIVNRSTGSLGSYDGEIVVPVGKTLALSNASAYDMRQIAKITLIAGATDGKVTRNSIDLLVTTYGMDIAETASTSQGLTIQYDASGNKDLTVNANTSLTFVTITDATANSTIGANDSLTVTFGSSAIVNIRTVIAGELAVDSGAIFTVNDIASALTLTNTATVDGTLVVVDTDLSVTGSGSIVFSEDAIFGYDGCNIIKNIATYGTFYVSDDGTITLDDVVDGNLLVGQFDMTVVGDLYINNIDVSQFASSHTVDVSGDVYVVSGLTINVNGTMTIGSSEVASSMYFVGSSASILNVVGTQIVYGSVIVYGTDYTNWGDITVNVSGTQHVYVDIRADQVTVNVTAGTQTVGSNIGSVTSTTVNVSSGASQNITGDINGKTVNITVNGTQNIYGENLAEGFYTVWANDGSISMTIAGTQTITGDVIATASISITVTGDQDITGDLVAGTDLAISVSGSVTQTIGGDIEAITISLLTIASGSTQDVGGNIDISGAVNMYSVAGTQNVTGYVDIDGAVTTYSVAGTQTVGTDSALTYLAVGSGSMTVTGSMTVYGYLESGAVTLSISGNVEVRGDLSIIDTSTISLTGAGRFQVLGNNGGAGDVDASDTTISMSGTSSLFMVTDFDADRTVTIAGLALSDSATAYIGYTSSSARDYVTFTCATLTFNNTTNSLYFHGELNASTINFTAAGKIYLYSDVTVHTITGTGSFILMDDAEFDISDWSSAGALNITGNSNDVVFYGGPDHDILLTQSIIATSIGTFTFGKDVGQTSNDVLYVVGTVETGTTNVHVAAMTTLIIETNIFSSTGVIVDPNTIILDDSSSILVVVQYWKFVLHYVSSGSWTTEDQYIAKTASYTGTAYGEYNWYASHSGWNPISTGYDLVNWTDSCGSTVNLNFMRPTNPGTSISVPSTYNVIDVYANYTVDVSYVNGSSTVVSKVALDTTVTLPIATPASGYEFIGWYDEDDFVGMAGEAYTVAGPVTLTAHFLLIPTYTVDFVGDGTAATISSITGLYDGQVVTLPEATLEGYTFIGWYVDGTPDSATVWGQYIVNASDASSGTITLHAKFVQDPVYYTVNFDYNGGTSGSGSIIVSAGTNIVLPTTSKTGYTFDGWYDDGTLVGGSTGYYTVMENVTLTAHFTIIPTYTVTFNFNGGTGSSGTVTVTSGTQIVLPTASKTGYTFDGWSSDGTSTVGGSTGYYTVTSTVTLTALFTPIPTYTVDFIGPEGSVYSPEYISSLYDGQTITLPTATLSGSTFVGWSVLLTVDDEQVMYSDIIWGQYVVSHLDADDSNEITLVPVFVEDPVYYTVTFNYNGGTAGESSISVVEGVNIVLPTTSKVGYTFDGWYYVVNEIRYDVGTAGQYYTVESDVTLIADFTQVQVYTVQFSVNDEVLGSCGVLEDNMIILPSAAGETGYEFVGWYVGSTEGTFAGVSGSVYTPTGNVTLVAKFVATSSHTVTYDATENGTVVGNTSAFTGGYVFIYTSPAAGYAVYSITVSGPEGSETSYAVNTLISGSLYMVIVGSEDLTVTVTFATSSNAFVITPEFIGEGSVEVSISGVGSMPEDAELTMTYTYLTEFMGGWMYTTEVKTYEVTDNPWSVVDDELDETTSAMVGTLSYTIGDETYYLWSGTVVYTG